MVMARILLDPYHLRTIVRKIVTRFKVGSYFSRLQLGCVDRPHYGYCLYNGALLAKKLGYSGISVLEFGVAGGCGLLNLEYHAKHIRELLSINVDIYGFDTGEGLPELLDYRDVPYLWRKNDYKMDVQKLKAKLKTAKLVLGDVKETAETFLSKFKPYPIAAIMFDLDLYSSTAAALKLLEGDEKYFLPRLFCYFDDVSGNEASLYNDYTGERLAINEFNQTHTEKKFAPAYHLLNRKVLDAWYQRVWILHNFKHSKYNEYIGRKIQQLELP
jgi:hypothetical protein